MFENSNIKHKILRKATKYSKDKLFINFLDSFYSYIPIDDKKSYDIDEFRDISELMYKELQHKPRDDHKVNIYLQKDLLPNTVGDDCQDNIIITIINDDMPFIVDSITELLNKRRYEINHIINSLLSIERDNKGQAVKINCDVKCHNESIIYINLNSISTRDTIAALKADISKILKHVRFAVHDWALMLGKLNETLKWFKSKDQLLDENKDFIEWLLNDNFTFIGYREYVVREGLKIITSKKEVLGINVIETSEFNNSIIEDVFLSNQILCQKKGVYVGKVREISRVHRYSSLDYVCVMTEGKNGGIRARVFLGLFVTRLDYQSVITIPLIRSKTEAVINKAGFDYKSFNGKELFSIIETLPRDELFQLTEDELFLMAMMILSSLKNPKLLFFVRENKCKVFLNLLVFFPKSRVTADIIDKIHKVISKTISGKIINSTLRFSSMGLVYVYISLKVKNNRLLCIDIPHIERELDNVTKQWNEHLDLYLKEKFDTPKANSLFLLYKNAFPSNYHSIYSLKNAVYDIEQIEKLSQIKNIIFNIYQEARCKRNHFKLKIYTYDDKLQLYKIMPVLDEMGFLTIDENVFQIDEKKLNKKVWIQDFSLYVEDRVTYNIEENKRNLQDAIVAVFNKKINNTLLNKLILKSSIVWREVLLLDAYCKYLLQIKFEYSQDLIKETLVNNATLVKLMIKLFNYRFKPHYKNKEEENSVRSKIKSSMLRITSGTDYKIIKKFLELFDSTLRTNYFQKTPQGAYKDYISFKFNSSTIEDIPLPKPYAEIFVYSTRAQGIHLRGGKIARGGLRWSDRVEDYRTEVLGLMKAQVTKNAIIVPEGSKGGFLVHNASTLKTREELLEEGIECYKIFLRGMLDITDNVVNHRVLKPKDTVCFDGDDPYLVIAADKGTATFSDIANKVAEEYNFWLGDAFASGGAAGYDHKKMAITAKGAWVSVIEHFKYLNINPNKDEFTVIGIGDMSGDVFGNGMLLSQKIRLIAAFNHLHIFIDPKPDAAISYKERKRLFEMKKSNWSDYNNDLISRGGGVFCRHTKSIKLSKEIRELFDIKQKIIDPDCLIRHILTCKADLLWSAGIGTYVKASSEIHEQIGNKSNDNVRVNAKNLKCSAVSEGGNLGFTQLARIEYAFNGGCINTDFIDNSAGVDCSDHEVNIKIALESAVSSGHLKLSGRDKLLTSMQEEVVDLVLRDNYEQNKNISISVAYAVEFFEDYIKLIKTLRDRVSLNPALEFLPNKAELARRQQEKLGFSRPELAVLMSYSKIAVYNELINSKLPDDPYYTNFLINYFPKKMQSKFKNEIMNHGLKREIVATSITNEIVNNVGIEFFHLAQDYTGLSGCDIARAYSIVWKIFDLENMERSIDVIKNNQTRIELFHIVRTFLQTSIYWFLRNRPHPLNVLKIVDEFHVGISVLLDKIGSFIQGNVKNRFKLQVDYLVKKKIHSKLATQIACLDSLYSSMDIVLISNKTGVSVDEVATLYFDLGEKFSYNWMKEKADSLVKSGYWKKMLIKAIKDDIYDQQRELVTNILLTKKKEGEASLEAWSNKYKREIRIYCNFTKSVKLTEDVDAAKLVVMTKQGNILINQ